MFYKNISFHEELELYGKAWISKMEIKEKKSNLHATMIRMF